jgi:DNA-binding response OmpR family regulator
MTRTRTRPLVAIFNSNMEFLDRLREAIDAEGYAAVTARLAEIQSGTLDLVAFIDRHDPELIIYNLPRPIERHWNFLRLLKETDSLKARIWILTTTDKDALDAAVGSSGLIDIVFGQPYDVADVVAAVRVALEAAEPGTGGP